jgi:SsrA-binding protein
MNSDVKIRNKKAGFEFELLEKYIAGIQLVGTEIKSLRQGKASLADAYCVFINHELYIKMHITEYERGGHYNHDAKRERKLLLNRKELNKLEDKVAIKGLTIVPTFLFINEQGRAKLEIALARGKKSFDKREDIKEKDTQREMDRYMKI